MSYVYSAAAAQTKVVGSGLHLLQLKNGLISRNIYIKRV